MLLYNLRVINSPISLSLSKVGSTGLDLVKLFGHRSSVVRYVSYHTNFLNFFFFLLQLESFMVYVK